METLQKLLKWIQNLPIVGKILTLIAIVLMMIVSIFFLTSCGTMTSATIRNIQPNTSTSISIQNNNTQDTDVNVTADPSVSLNKQKE